MRCRWLHLFRGVWNSSVTKNWREKMQIEKSKTNDAPRVIVYGTEGIGKSTFASLMPDPVFIDAENGLGRIDAMRIGVSSFPEIKSAMKIIYESQAKTIVLDSLDAIERLIFES